MAATGVSVPMSLLMNSQLTAADKLIWMIMLLDQFKNSIAKANSPSWLSERTGLSRFTIYNSLRRLTVAGWYKAPFLMIGSGDQKNWVTIPTLLLTGKEVHPRDVVVYGLLQDTPFFYEEKGTFTYLALSQHTQLCVKTVRRAVQALAKANWINIEQANRLAQIHFNLDNPCYLYCQQLEKRIDNSPFKGEAIGLAMVTFLVEQTEYQVNPKLSVLVNPDTEAYMEVDLYIPEYRLAVEFNGEQHYNPTNFSSTEEVAKQKARDAIKAQILRAEKINLVVLRNEDLSLYTIKNQLIGLAPLRILEGLEHIERFLNNKGWQYRYAAHRKQAKARAEAQKLAQTQAQVPEEAQTQSLM